MWLTPHNQDLYTILDLTSMIFDWHHITLAHTKGVFIIYVGGGGQKFHPLSGVGGGGGVHGSFDVGQGGGGVMKV